MIARKTTNGNYLVFDDKVKEYRFVNNYGSHIHWVSEEEADYLCKVIVPADLELTVDVATPPITETIWQHVKPPENSNLSNNGGSYAFLHRIERLEGWGGGIDGIRLITNDCYGSDYEEQGYNLEEYFSNEGEAWEWIENFNSSGVVA